jgi:hypothetical protein
VLLLTEGAQSESPIDQRCLRGVGDPQVTTPRWRSRSRTFWSVGVVVVVGFQHHFVEYISSAMSFSTSSENILSIGILPGGDL